MEDSHLASAKNWLAHLRLGTASHKIYLEYLREYLASGKVTLEEIGTTEEGLERLRVLGCKTSAENWLNQLRQGRGSSGVYLGYLREYLARGNLTLKDIGTTEEELEELRVLGCKTSAERWLDYLRENADTHSFYLGYLREHLARGKLTPEDIGTTEEELVSFIPALV